MKLKSIIKSGPLLITLFCITAIAMNKRPAESEGDREKPAKRAHTKATVKLLTSDDQVIEIPEKLALQSSLIKNMIQDLGESDEPMPLPITAVELVKIMEVLEALNEARQDYIKLNGRYIAYRILPIIDRALPVDNVALAGIITAAQFLDLEYVVNGAARLLVQRVLHQSPQAGLDVIKNIWIANHITLPSTVRDKFLEHQYNLLRSGNSSELSLADYIETTTGNMPQVQNGELSINCANLTSLEGIDQIVGSAQITKLKLTDVGDFLLTENTFSRFTDLQVLNISGNFTHLRNTFEFFSESSPILKPLRNLQKLTLHGQLTDSGLPLLDNLINLLELDLEGNHLVDVGGAFDALINLKDLYLSNNQINRLSPGIFNTLANLQVLYLPHNVIESIEAGTFTGLRHLKTLDLRSNDLAILPSTAFNGLSNLEILDLGNNQLTQASLSPDIFNDLTRLQALQVAGNPLTENSNMQQFKQQYNIPNHVLVSFDDIIDLGN